MTTDYRALCAELVDIVTAHCTPDDSAVGYCAAVLTRARAELAKPEPPELTDYDLDNLASEFLDWNREGLRAFARAAIAADRARRHG
jgi:hypothetical protein